MEEEVDGRYEFEKRTYAPWMEVARHFIGAQAPHGWDRELAGIPGYYSNNPVLVISVGMNAWGTGYVSYDDVPMVTIATIDRLHGPTWMCVRLSMVLFRHFEGIDGPAYARSVARIRRLLRCTRPEPRINKRDLCRVV